MQYHWIDHRPQLMPRCWNSVGVILILMHTHTHALGFGRGRWETRSCACMSILIEHGLQYHPSNFGTTCLGSSIRLQLGESGLIVLLVRVAEVIDYQDNGTETEGNGQLRFKVHPSKQQANT